MSDPSPLDLTQFVVKEHVGLLKLTDVYDIFDAKTQQKVALARENISGFLKVLRLLVNKQMLPTRVTVTQGDENGPVLFEIKRPVTIFRSKVSVFDAGGTPSATSRARSCPSAGASWSTTRRTSRWPR